MTRILIVQGHPDAAQTHLCHAIADAYRQSAEAAGHSVETITIATCDMPFLRTKEAWESGELPPVAADGQRAVAQAEHLVLIYPLWLGDVPALVKAWLEQVFRQGFAFTMNKTGWTPALRGKSARVFVTMGMPGFAYRWFFMAHSLRSLERNILKFCGFGPVRSCVFGNAEDPTGRAQEAFLTTARNLGAQAR